MDDEEGIIQFEKLYWNRGIELVGGVDEAGRGPLAGPVAAAVVMFPINTKPFVFRDSKRLSARKRDEFFYIIINRSLAYGVGFSDSREIERLNILNATKLAVKRALRSMPIKPKAIITDFQGLMKDELPLVKGDERSFSCASASILAKVSRDYILNDLSRYFPEYRLSKNKGYPTREHIQSLAKFGYSPIHRRTFKHVKVAGKRKNWRESGFPFSVKERLQYYSEKLQELVRGDRSHSLQ
ncbi:MAG: ribonuclease HII [Nitrospiraceae bacterium]|nr:ribonuclease HII [Nitrospiraceae bacterium]